MKTSCSTNTTSLPDGLTTSQQLCRIQSDEVGFVKGNTVMPESLRDLVARRRRELGLTQEELSERAGMSQEWASKVERGEIQSPRRSALRRLADALQVPAEDVIIAAGYAEKPSTARILLEQVEGEDAEDVLATWLPVLLRLKKQDRDHMLRTARLLLRGYLLSESDDIFDASPQTPEPRTDNGGRGGSG